MPVQAIVSAAADEPAGLLTADHPLAALAARKCKTSHLPTLPPALIAGVACGGCWADVLVTDMLFAIENELPWDVEVDPTYVDEVAVERAVRLALETSADTEAAHADLELTDLERTEVRRRLADIRSRRNRRYRFTCSRAAGARREVSR
ncbi:hypothetical protein CS0771_07510 [Catellatospora sp. IY07-71]|uniref:hypothetical protein n=1 Tax=Catellatospora sp. IY07-71 TaxID=2728827 RepID=UPI001BB36144|nr:hypothetical protein [Catellatospora sp. IY07-71]BCJ71207.1 hypothetical protein CS0771_07510 [Catellatospora sp. IY07-71]